MNLEEDLLGDQAVEMLLDIANQQQSRDPRMTSGRPDFKELFSAVGCDKVGCYICGPPVLMETAAREASTLHFWIHTEVFEF
ncbi:Hypothetical protein, putative [Bodo saltans]|uniref:Uncharacterized protein n=1 Tax=Bodo saltans TaxID=75058 RepID=A0A0S4ISA1_BODSA|nr:Hypothetical protein, putative [Bodo saltans]|eukprot:CUE71640.1 Hypothetical protein, putative [Bodo saltans]